MSSFVPVIHSYSQHNMWTFSRCLFPFFIFSSFVVFFLLVFMLRSAMLSSSCSSPSSKYNSRLSRFEMILKRRARKKRKIRRRNKWKKKITWNERDKGQMMKGDGKKELKEKMKRKMKKNKWKFTWERQQPRFTSKNRKTVELKWETFLLIFFFSRFFFIFAI